MEKYFQYMCLHVYVLIYFQKTRTYETYIFINLLQNETNQNLIYLLNNELQYYNKLLHQTSSK